MAQVVKSTLKRLDLKELIDFAWYRSPFYKRFWSDRDYIPNDSNAVIEELPILNKEDLINAPFEERFIPGTTTGYYFPAISGGTVNTPMVSLIHAYAVPRFFTQLKKQLPPLRSLMVVRPGIYASAFVNALQPAGYLDPETIISLGDPNDLEHSAKLANKLGVDFICIRPSEAAPFANALHETGYNPEHVRLVWLTGEPITPAAIEMAKEKFTQAAILSVYAMTEGPSAIGMYSSRCQTLLKKGTNVYHLNTEDYLCESIDGKLVITALYEMPMPIIRYNTGDEVTILDKVNCSCGHDCQTAVIVHGRAGSSAYKIGGITLKATDIASVLYSFAGLCDDNFNLVTKQVFRDDDLLTELTLFIKPKENDSDFLAEQIATTLRNKLIVAGKLTLGDMEKRNRVRFNGIVFDRTIVGQKIIPPSLFK